MADSPDSASQVEWFKNLVQSNDNVHSAKEKSKAKDNEIQRKLNAYINPEFKDEQLNVTVDQKSCI